MFFSMATSSGEDPPRDAGSSSPATASTSHSPGRSPRDLVCSPALLDTRATSVEDMRLINTLCRFADTATRRVPTA